MRLAQSTLTDSALSDAKKKFMNSTLRKAVSPRRLGTKLLNLNQFDASIIQEDSEDMFSKTNFAFAAANNVRFEESVDSQPPRAANP